MMVVEPNTVVLLVIAAMNAGTGYLAYLAKRTAAETKEIALKTEINTNSLQDALVAATKGEAHAAGLEQGRTEGEARATIIAKDKLQGKLQGP